MVMKVKVLWGLLLLNWLISPLAMASVNPAWYYPFVSSNFSAWKVEDYEQSPTWFDCAEDEVTIHFCSDEEKVYQTEVWAQLFITENDQPSLLLSTDFNLIDFNRLYFGVRQDGFQLQAVEINNIHYDVSAQLLNKPASVVDTEVFQLINAYSVTTPRTLYLRSPDSAYQAIWYSDQDTIQIRFAP
jgi:hypothetical protein